MRKTAQKLTEYRGFGGSYHDYISHASMFRSETPYDFGMQTAKLFSTDLKGTLVNKKFAHMTIGKGNYFKLPGGTDTYEWSVMGDTNIDYRITELLEDPASQPGKDGQSFYIALDRDWLHEPAVILSENPDVPQLIILGYPVRLSANSFKYEVRLQSGDPNDWMPIDLISPDRLFVRTSSVVPDEDNGKYAPDSYGQATKLRSWTGQYANKVEFSNKFLRKEIASAKQGVDNYMKYKDGSGASHSDAVTSGFIYQASLKEVGTNNVINKGVFITKAEARLLERTEADRENMCEFGRLQEFNDRDTGRPTKVAPGWRQLVRDYPIIVIINL